jgi:hypothetical protein
MKRLYIERIFFEQQNLRRDNKLDWRSSIYIKRCLSYNFCILGCTKDFIGRSKNVGKTSQKPRHIPHNYCLFLFLQNKRLDPVLCSIRKWLILLYIVRLPQLIYIILFRAYQHPTW